MKQLLFSLITCTFFISQTPLCAQRLVCSPEKPLPGETLTLRYDPTGSPLAGAESFDATAYYFDFDQNDQPIAAEIPLIKEGNLYTATIPSTKTTKAILFGFSNNESEKLDNNDDNGFKVLFYQADRTSPVQGAYAAKAMIYGSMGYLGNVKTDREKAISLLQKEFEFHPASKQNAKFFALYASLGARTKNEAVLEAVKNRIADLTSVKKTSEDQLLEARTLCLSTGNETQLKTIEDELRKKFPKGKIGMYDLAKSFNETQELKDKVAIFEKLHKNYGAQKDAKSMIDRFAGQIAKGYGNEGNWTNFQTYLGKIANKSQAANMLNSIAWDLSGESIEAEGKELERAKNLSARSLQLLEEEMTKMVDKGVSQTPKQYRENLGYGVGMYADTYALLAFKTGNPQEALKYQQIACDKNKFSDGEMNERYCVYLEAEKGGVEAEKFLANFMAEGKATSKMKEQHKRLFLANNTLESAYDKFLVQIEKEAIHRKKEEIKQKMLDQAAPDFKLVNLKGEEVSLAGLKGKVVVIDFWATWCGPCKASFPGMQRAVDKFSKNEDVEFLFIDTWENAADKAKNAADFIASKNYTFNVLMDLEDKTVAAFGVSGIPTKFVVDKNGKIRFKSVGFNGNDEELVQELSFMIELAGGSMPVATAAP